MSQVSTVTRWEPKPKLQNNHEAQKRQIALAALEKGKLLIGDSIVKYLDQAVKDSGKEMNWINTGMIGDCVENVHWRVRDNEQSKDKS